MQEIMERLVITHTYISPLIYKYHQYIHIRLDAIAGYEAVEAHRSPFQLVSWIIGGNGNGKRKAITKAVMAGCGNGLINRRILIYLEWSDCLYPANTS